MEVSYQIPHGWKESQQRTSIMNDRLCVCAHDWGSALQKDYQRIAEQVQKPLFEISFTSQLKDDNTSRNKEILSHSCNRKNELKNERWVREIRYFSHNWKQRSWVHCSSLKLLGVAYYCVPHVLSFDCFSEYKHTFGFTSRLCFSKELWYTMSYEIFHGLWKHLFCYYWETSMLLSATNWGKC